MTGRTTDEAAAPATAPATGATAGNPAQPASFPATLPYGHVDDLFIDGAWRAASGTGRTTVTNPATEAAWGSVPVASTADVDLAVAAARRAFARAGADGWRGLAPSERAGYLERLAGEIEKRSVAISHTNTAENGSPVAETGRAASNAAAIFRYFAGLAGYLETVDVRPFPDGSAETVVRQDPVGVCALIAPWNFPINLVVAKLAPALMAGCTVVIKPASPTPLSIRFIADAVAAAGIPAGVVNIVTGNSAVGDALVRHPGVDKVAFTGSTPVGRRIAGACGELLRPVTLELGGKSSALVLPDVDLSAMQQVLIRSCLRNTGQTCYISTRILAPAGRYDELVDMVTATVQAARQGDPMDPDTVFGPAATRAQRDTVRAYIRSGIAEGARATTGGDVPSGFDRGYFVPPTVFTGVTPGMRIAREEIFGPVLSILRYDTLDEAIGIANNTAFGLGGTVFSADADAAFDAATRMDTGSVGLGFFASNHNAPFAGRHDSGLGAEFGREGLHAYLKPQSVHRRIR
ncbi:aldehyde dehydrogenase family protein [Cryobacterium algoricola]|uniref:Aldehyde dehydrogenase family protein n=1 Tax=Cryobacterium algoricola TaxID=1259183 RepID=A0ABY2IFW6_9MICO|nr:aldehyde dehydrogenase family protein [Cryobacterium algoricola]TFB87494.1 aldehyde dehydrogenase family protein [Cryobacterium algoricola]